MEIENFSTIATVQANDGTRFELTDEMQRWGYVLKRNGQIDKKNNQAMLIWKGPDGEVYSADNNGSVFVWANGAWNYVIKDHKQKTIQLLQSHGQPTDIYGSRIATTPAPIQTTTASKPNILDKAVDLGKKYLDEKMAENKIYPGEMTLELPMSGNGPLYQQEILEATETETKPLQAKAPFDFKNPLVIGGMVLGVIALIFLAKKFS